MDDDAPRILPIRALGATVILATFVLGTYAGMEAIARVVAWMSGHGSTDAHAFIGSRPVFAGLAQAASAAVVLAGARMAYFKTNRYAPALGVVPVSYAILGYSALLGLFLQLPLAELGNVAERAWPVPVEDKLRVAALLSPETFIDGFGLVLAVVVIAPVAEELVFRGLLMAGIARGAGIVVGVLISTLGFAISHGRPTVVVVAFAGGLTFAVVAYRTRSVLPSIVAHAVHNAVPVLLPMRVLALPGWNVPLSEPSHVPWALWVPSLIAGLIVLARLVAHRPSEVPD